MRFNRRTFYSCRLGIYGAFLCWMMNTRIENLYCSLSLVGVRRDSHSINFNPERRKALKIWPIFVHLNRNLKQSMHPFPPSRLTRCVHWFRGTTDRGRKMYLLKLIPRNMDKIASYLKLPTNGHFFSSLSRYSSATMESFACLPRANYNFCCSNYSGWGILSKKRKTENFGAFRVKWWCHEIGRISSLRNKRSC